MLETASGGPFIFKAGEDLLGSVDIGDWVLRLQQCRHKALL